MNAIGKRAIVIGGSLAGLFAGTLLRSIGWQVDIYERLICWWVRMDPLQPFVTCCCPITCPNMLGMLPIAA
jgi:2-polyprenyl-6-methoxyphenol hydroxylase-like FAD-dependent oxidoreductase